MEQKITYQKLANDARFGRNTALILSLGFLLILFITIILLLTGLFNNGYVKLICLSSFILFLVFGFTANSCSKEYKKYIIEVQKEQRLKELIEADIQRTHNKTQFDKKIGSKEFKNYLQQFEHLAKNAAELVRVNKENRGFSKFGGLPTVPTGFVWPTNNDEPKLFLAQFDFAEINPNGILQDFPTSGLLYLFSEQTMDPFENSCVLLFFKATNNLQPAVKPDKLAAIYKEIYVTSKTIKTYPDIDNSKEAFEIYENANQEEMGNIYFFMQSKNNHTSFIGGWASNSGENEFCAEYVDDIDEWTLLGQIDGKYAHINAKEVEEFSSWGDDGGTIFLYIRKEDLKARDFSRIEVDIDYY